MWWNGGGWEVGNWVAMILIMLAFWGLLVALTVWVVSRLSQRAAHDTGQRQTANSDGALEDRFARGESNEHELIRQAALVHDSHRPAPAERE
jgi:uncharacterized membrane protein